MVESTKQAAGRQYDIAETAGKVRAALKKLEENKKPGEQTGKGRKTDVLQAAKADIKKLLSKGYTAKQIAEAISEDVFGILPKSITQLITAQKCKTKSGARKTSSDEKQGSGNAQSMVVKNNRQVTDISDVE